MPDKKIITTNMILYCRNWKKTVQFYRDILRFPIRFSSDWFYEFSLNESSRLSIADENRSSIKAPLCKGLTITMQVEDIDATWSDFSGMQLNPTPIQSHPWHAKVFYIVDPEGHRLEIWQETKEYHTK
ncbi:MAG TPA: glyoxalase [Desulfobacteraceae bacterium]|nr:glyoxalase [Desulfobacteraceae bacterium]|tara:strand:- start:2186 stop:2569 length:384 start_codon:yes stop_codon:yes gene_type:complete